MQKYAMLRQRVVEAGLAQAGEMCVPHAATDEELARGHDRAYIQRVLAGELTPQEVRRIGLPWSPGLVERSRRSCGATIEACRLLLQPGSGRPCFDVAVNLAGGTHHAFRDHGEGYCVFNDVAVAARAALAAGLCRRVVIIDCDVHQGNGTAAILAGDPAVFTFSIHGAKNFPFHKEQSDLDVELPDGAEDVVYLAALEEGLEQAFAMAESSFDLAIYLAGADPFAGDTFGRLKLSKVGLAERDRLVLQTCRRADLPVAITMAGGYARHVEDTVAIHFETVRLAAEAAPR
jgi:acetoin utilization deacetylase AcuC-like enzyme